MPIPATKCPNDIGDSIADQTAYAPNQQGICTPRNPVVHREDQYDSAIFDLLHDMQRRHFWYVGRHRFLLHALQRQLKTISASNDGLRAIDLGGGCGGWVGYLHQHLPGAFGELALGDSSQLALNLARPVIAESIGRYQIDLLDLQWNDRWDVAFLLDVLEHIPADELVLRQIWQSLRPGGLLFVTTPALQAFWTHNDEIVHHVRRYSRADFARLAGAAGFECCSTRYFMFLLSPLLLLSRIKRVDPQKLSPEQIQEYLKRTHRIPPAWANRLLACIFAAETPLGHWLPFPWGTSVLGVFRKPSTTANKPCRA